MDQDFPGKAALNRGCCNPCADLSFCAQLTVPFRLWSGQFSLLRRTGPDVCARWRQSNGQVYQEVTRPRKSRLTR